MKRVLAALSAALILVTSGLYGPGSRAAIFHAPGKMSIQVLSPTGPVTVPVNGKIPIRVRITGMRLNMAAMGRKAVPGEGHYHFYVDCIPSIAYAKNNNLGACWAGAVASANTVFDLATSHVKVRSGTHILLLALAQNDHILYRAPAADVVFTVAK